MALMQQLSSVRNVKIVKSGIVTQALYVFDTEDAPSSYDNFEWTQEWCDSFASQLVASEQLVKFEWPATSHLDFEWVRVEYEL